MKEKGRQASLKARLSPFSGCINIWRGSWNLASLRFPPHRRWSCHLFTVYEVDLQVFDFDGQEGINIPNSMESDAIHEIGANMGSTMGSSINLTTNTGAQIASDVGRGLINGVSQYLNKKLRTVKVHLKAGYRVMLYQPDDT